MAGPYAKDQPSSFNNHISNIAIVGAGGRSGRFMVEALVKGGKHKLTALTRPNSTAKMPSGLHAVKHVDYDDKPSLVEAMKGSDVLIITMAVTAPRDTQIKLIDAAVEAGVPWIMPNEWGGAAQRGNPQLAKDTMMGEGLIAIRDYIKKVGGDKTHAVGLACGFWYEFSLAGTEARYGFDFNKKEVTFYDNGETKLSTSTFPQVGRAVASLLSLKVLPDDANDKSLTLSHYKDGSVYVASFTVNQKEMFESVLRVTGDSEKDWKISYEDVKARYKRGFDMMQQGQMLGFGILLYARMFYPEAPGDYSAKLDNEKLGLPKEDLDEWTKVAVKMAKEGENNVIH
jgi:hypothetical protein